MSIYQKIAKSLPRYIAKATLFKYGFNLSPMYRTTTARIIDVSDDLLQVRIKIPISYRNRNYVSSIFGGSMFAAVDPIPMVQLINLLGDDYIAWDKSAEVAFRRPAKETLYAQFSYSIEELDDIRARVEAEKEIEIVKQTRLTNEQGTVTYCEVLKTLYVADKKFYKEKRKNRAQKNIQAAAHT